MSRLIAAAMLVTLALSGGPAALARDAAAGFSLVAPVNARAKVTTAATLRLPQGVAAVDGRVMFDTSVAELVGVAPSGRGTGLAPVDIPGGAAFGAYGLASGSSLRLVFVIQSEGRLGLRLVVDAAADELGKRVYSNSSMSATITAGSSTASFAAPRAATPVQPLRAAIAVRDTNSDGRLSRLDLDLLRAGWESSRANGTACDSVAASADANGDGCLDVVDMQSALSASAATSDTQEQLGVSRSAAVPASATFTVTSAADTADKNPGDGKCADSNNKCTLRAAITEANWMQGDNRIVFNLAGSAPVQIKLTKESNPIIQDRTGGLEIDGYSQPGAKLNTASVGSNAIPGIEIKGTKDAPTGNAFRITSANNVIRGFVLNDLYRAIFLDGPDAHHNDIVGNLIGLKRDGGVPGFEGENGVRLNNGVHDNRIGGTALADRNMFGKVRHGIDVYGPGTDLNVMQNNYLCMTPNGLGVAMCATAIDLSFGPKNNLIGGAGTARNVIGPTSKNGVEIAHGWDPDTAANAAKWQINSNIVRGNWIGFRGNGAYDPEFRSGQDPPGDNDANGINIDDGSNLNVVEDNFIASKYDGVNIMSSTSTGNVVRGNTIGISPKGEAAPLTRYGIHLREATRLDRIVGNTISNVGSDAIALTDPTVARIRISRNIVTSTPGRAIFLAVSSQTPSLGANNKLAAPTITRATTWRAFGTGKPGAVVEIYQASRAVGLSGLPTAFLGSGVVKDNGTFIVSIRTTAQTRVVGLQIDPQNNTSALGKNVVAIFEKKPLAPVAGFTWAPRANQTIEFTDDTTRRPTAWAWDFGDGGTSSSRNPSHQFPDLGEYTVTLTVSNAKGSDSISKKVTVGGQSPSTETYARDGFGRTVGGGWGDAEVGGTYGLQGVASDYNVAGGSGSILSTAGGTRAALLNGILRRDVDVRFRVKVDRVATGGSFIVYATTRKISNSEYRPRLVFNANGTISVGASVVSGGTENPIELPVVVSGLTQAVGKYVWLRTQVTGASPTTIRVKAWEEGEAEPTGWQFTATDSLAALQAPGGVGLRLFVGSGVTNAPITFGFDDFSVVSIQ